MTGYISEKIKPYKEEMEMWWFKYPGGFGYSTSVKVDEHMEMITDFIFYERGKDWRDRCREIARRLGIEVDHHPKNEGKIVKGLYNLHKKMIKWKETHPKRYWKYKKIINEITDELRE